MELSAQFGGSHNLQDFSGELITAEPSERCTGYCYTYEAQHQVLWDDAS